MRSLLILLSWLTLTAQAAPCQIELRMMSGGKLVATDATLDADGLLAREAMTQTIQDILAAIEAAGLEVVDAAPENLLVMDLKVLRKNDRPTGTSIDMSLNYESREGGRQTVTFRRENSLSRWADPDDIQHSLTKRVGNALQHLSQLPGCRSSGASNHQ